MSRTFTSKLENKKIRDEELAEEAATNKELLHELLRGVSSPTPRVRFRSAKILRIISQTKPETLYPNWEFFVKLLDSENHIIKWNALDIVANLTKLDSHNKFDRIFNKFFNYLREGSLITASHIVSNSGTIARAKPGLQDKITKELLTVPEITLPTEECRDILIGHTMEAFDAYYDNVKDKEGIVQFVENQLNNSRRATRTKAERLLKKLDKR